jgi:hypothetical protein
MKHPAIENFISALREWDEVTGEYKAADFHTLLFSINYQIGIKDHSMLRENDTDKFLNSLEARIKGLVNDEKMREIFLIKSLTNYVTKFFKDMLETHGDSILFNEKIINEHPEMEVIKEVLERLKESNYVTKIKVNCYRWQEIVSIRLSDEQFDAFDRDLIIENAKNDNYSLEEIEKKYGNMTMGEILDKELLNK